MLAICGMTSPSLASRPLTRFCIDNSGKKNALAGSGLGVGVRLGFGLGCLGLGLGLRLGLALQLQQGGKLVVFYTLLSMRSSHSSLKLASTKDAIVLLHCHSHVSSNSCNPGCCLRCLQHKGCGSGWRHRLEWLPGATTFSALL